MEGEKQNRYLSIKEVLAEIQAFLRKKREEKMIEFVSRQAQPQTE